MQEKKYQDGLTQQQFDNTLAQQQYQDKLRQQQFTNDVTSQRLNIAKGEWALKQSKAAQQGQRGCGGEKQHQPTGQHRRPDRGQERRFLRRHRALHRRPDAQSGQE